MTDTLQTSKALIVFAFGLPAYMMTKALSPFFYARHDTTTPVKIAVIGVILNAILALTFMQFWGFVGIALATTITVWVNAFQYMWRLKRQGEFSLDSLFMYRLNRIISAVILMGAVLFFGTNLIESLFPLWQHEHGFISVLWLGMLIAGGLITFAGVLIGTKGITITDLKQFMRSKTN